MKRAGLSLAIMVLATFLCMPAWAQYTGGNGRLSADPPETPPGGPLVVELDSFTAVVHPQEGYVLVSWETATELDCAGFNLWSSDTEDGEYVRINETLIPCVGSAVEGAAYEFEDPDCPGWYCFYMLQDINFEGDSSWHGPISVDSEAWQVQTAQAHQMSVGTAAASKGFNLFGLILPPAAVIALWIRRNRRKKPI